MPLCPLEHTGQYDHKRAWRLAIPGYCPNQGWQARGIAIRARTVRFPNATGGGMWGFRQVLKSSYFLLLNPD
eukprot:169717-Pelagomonas_calceolata.AAC.1